MWYCGRVGLNMAALNTQRRVVGNSPENEPIYIFGGLWKAPKKSDRVADEICV
jgi:hypothetical protein